MNGSAYMQGHGESVLASHRTRSAEKQADYLLPKITATSRILDVGCGPGTITCDFARIASQGQVFGVDYSEAALGSAQNEARDRSITNITFQTGTAHSLPFDDETFDIVHCHAVLVHIPDVPTALREMRRVCKTGGYVAAGEPDWGTCIIHPHDARLQRWIEVHRELKRRENVEPNCGRHLATWALEAGFDQDKVNVDCDVLRYFGTEQVRWWGQLYSKRMPTEVGERAIKYGVATAEEVEQFATAYLQWSQMKGALWAMTRMKFLGEK
ncbi:hypothetical protein M409DRAFT_63900 [Zasmidium cellare ATCC 36951]|uniref:Methyltransferase domain-containing protein n=1 Tax=Zasmidium cellare ATCC 36951 TaxID=1080233 RepID=A0A6A6CYA3_ZASCE|nr:uncharacterized protein M409DRAFT_63900 [Zasmidium cellare ATCC 36951]KAF2170862.1 hypothetical protein M409DRAFT_63900 [Zasmidium cellare ATCC 36951]